MRQALFSVGAPNEDIPARVYRLDLDAHSSTDTSTPAAHGFHDALVVAGPCEFELLLDGRPVHVSAQQPISQVTPCCWSRARRSATARAKRRWCVRT